MIRCGSSSRICTKEKLGSFVVSSSSSSFPFASSSPSSSSLYDDDSSFYDSVNSAEIARLVDFRSERLCRGLVLVGSSVSLSLSATSVTITSHSGVHIYRDGSTIVIPTSGYYNSYIRSDQKKPLAPRPTILSFKINGLPASAKTSILLSDGTTRDILEEISKDAMEALLLPYVVHSGKKEEEEKQEKEPSQNKKRPFCFVSPMDESVEKRRRLLLTT